MRVVEREREHYDVQEVPYGKVYRWHPERIIIECDCGERLIWTAPVTVCRCGANYVYPGEEGTKRRPEATHHPWIDEYEEWRRQKETLHLQHEYYGFVEEQ